MDVRKFGHACLLVEEAGARVLLDPGTFSSGWEGLRDLQAVLVTHQHPDHLDLDRIGALLAANPDATVYADTASVADLAKAGHAATAVSGGDHLAVGDLGIDVLGRDHATIHPDVPIIPNVGYLFADRLLHPGDALTVPDRPVDVLAVPVAAPWSKVWEVVDYVRAVAPRVAVPIHEAVAAFPPMYYSRVTDLAPERTTVEILDDGEPRTF